MDAENIGSHAPYMQTVAIDTAARYRYLKVQGNISNQTSQRRKVDDVIPRLEEERPLSSIKMQYINVPVIESMGLDPMVSSAAVIHELAYGRRSDMAGLAKAEGGYVLKGDYLPVRLDLII